MERNARARWRQQAGIERTIIIQQQLILEMSGKKPLSFLPCCFWCGPCCYCCFCPVLLLLLLCYNNSLCVWCSHPTFARVSGDSGWQRHCCLLLTFYWHFVSLSLAYLFLIGVFLRPFRFPALGIITKNRIFLFHQIASSTLGWKVHPFRLPEFGK